MIPMMMMIGAQTLSQRNQMLLLTGDRPNSMGESSIKMMNMVNMNEVMFIDEIMCISSLGISLTNLLTSGRCGCNFKCTCYRIFKL